MGKKSLLVDAYIAKSATFAKPILRHIRKVVHAGCPEVEEAMKWSMPHFLYKGMLCNMAAFKEHCAFGFWKGRLIFPDQAGSREAMGHFGRITSVSELPPTEVLIGYVAEAKRLNEAGVKSPNRSKPRKEVQLEVPDYFTGALRTRPEALKNFEGFSFSHKREYVEWVSGAKRVETRQRRLGLAVEQIAAGKHQYWKYENCGKAGGEKGSG